MQSHKNNPPEKSDSENHISTANGKSHNSRNRYHGPENNIHKNPQTVEANRIARKANNIAIWSTAIGALLFIATLLVFYQTVRQTNAAVTSANAAKQSADLQKAALDSQISAKKQSDIVDAKKLKIDTDFINKQKEGIERQITSFDVNEKQFSEQNAPYIQATDFNFEYHVGIKPVLEYYFFNLSETPVKIISIKSSTLMVGITAPKIDTIKFTHQKTEVEKYIIKNVPLREWSTMRTKLTTEDSIKENGNIFYLAKEVIYKNLITNNMRSYKFLVAMQFLSGGRFYQTYIYNENTDINK